MFLFEILRKMLTRLNNIKMDWLRHVTDWDRLPTTRRDRLLMCPECSLLAHYTCDNVWVSRNTGARWGTLGIIEMFLWLADVSVCGNSEVQLSPVVSQHRRIALLSMKLTIVFTYSPPATTTHQYTTTRDSSIQISNFFTGGLVRTKISL